MFSEKILLENVWIYKRFLGQFGKKKKKKKKFTRPTDRFLESVRP